MDGWRTKKEKLTRFFCESFSGFLEIEKTGLPNGLNKTAIIWCKITWNKQYNDITENPADKSTITSLYAEKGIIQLGNYLLWWQC